MKEEEIRKIIKLISNISKEFGISDAFYVGGYPRTIAMDLPLSDISDMDIATASVGKANQLAGFVAEKYKNKNTKIHHRTMTTTLSVNDIEIDFQGPMENDYVLEYLHENNIETTPLAINIFGRDFTINSLAIPVNRNDILIDLTEQGIKDIKRKVISSIIPPEKCVPKNLLMITRAIRFAAKYEFDIEDKLWQEMKNNVDKLIKNISINRLAIEYLVLSKYDTKNMLLQLGLDFLSSEKKIIEFANKHKKE